MHSGQSDKGKMNICKTILKDSIRKKIRSDTWRTKLESSSRGTHSARKSSSKSTSTFAVVATSKRSCTELKGLLFTKQMIWMTRLAGAPAKDNDKCNRPRKDSRGLPREPHHRFTKHRELNTTRSKILAECVSAVFKDKKWPAQLVQREYTNKKKYCRYHWIHDHNTDQYRVLRDDIEEMMQKEKLTQYVKKEEDED